MSGTWDRQNKGAARFPWPVRAALVLMSAIHSAHVWLLRKLPRTLAYRFAYAYSRLFALAGHRRRRANLRVFARGLNWTEAAYARTCRRHFRYLAWWRLGVARALDLSPAQLRETATLAGRSHLDAALAQGRGVLVIGSHMGAWWQPPALMASLGYPVTVISNRLPVASLVRHVSALAERFGFKIAWLGQRADIAARESFLENTILYIKIDMLVRQERTLWLSLGPVRMEIDPGPAILALISRAPVLHATTVDGSPGRSVVNLRPSPGLPEGCRNLEAVCQNWFNVLAEDLQRHPEQWWGWTYTTLRPQPETAQDQSPQSYTAGPTSS